MLRSRGVRLYESFGFDDRLELGRHNSFGSWSDGETSHQLQLKLGDKDLTFPGTGVAAESAFPVLRGLRGKIVIPLKGEAVGIRVDDGYGVAVEWRLTTTRTVVRDDSVFV